LCRNYLIKAFVEVFDEDKLNQISQQQLKTSQKLMSTLMGTPGSPQPGKKPTKAGGTSTIKKFFAGNSNPKEKEIKRTATSKDIFKTASKVLWQNRFCNILKEDRKPKDALANLSTDELIAIIR
jgi:hypothetical protein